jgi:uncharacterized cupredoxin-like copper-binding protein
VTRTVACLAALVLAVGAAGCARGVAAEPLTPHDQTIVLRVRHSRFTPERVSVRDGTTVRFVVHNEDPIPHELIVGEPAVHLRHERGTEPWHPPRPGEVSIEAGALASTTFTFTKPGTTEFACHLPGHYAYGMKGVVTVSP